MLSSDKLAQAFAIGAAPATDEYRFGTVASTEDGIYVRMSNSATTRCTTLCDVEVGDRVQVCIKANGSCVILGTIGKEEGPKPLAPHVLRANASGYNGTVTLEDSAANYAFIDVYFCMSSSDGGYGYEKQIDCCRVYSPNGNKAQINAGAYFPDSKVGQSSFVTYAINGTTMTREMPWYSNFQNNTVYSGTASNARVVAVIGYK